MAPAPRPMMEFKKGDRVKVKPQFSDLYPLFNDEILTVSIVGYGQFKDCVWIKLKNNERRLINKSFIEKYDDENSGSHK